MKKLGVLLFVLYVGLSIGFAQKQSKSIIPTISEDWKEAYYNEKVNFQKTLKGLNYPIESPIVRAKQDPIHFSAEIKGLKNMVLVVHGTDDGNANDHLTLINARLIDATGKVVYLNEVMSWFLDPSDNYYQTSPLVGVGTVKFNRSAATWVKKAVVAGKEYERTFIINPFSIISIPLNGRYVRFETELGMEQLSTNGTAVLRVQDRTGLEVVESMRSRFPKEIGLLNSYAYLEMIQLLYESNLKQERSVAVSVMNQLKDKAPMQKEFQRIDQLSDEREKFIAYLSFVEKVSQIVAIQEQLNWINIPAIELAMADMRKQSGYNFGKNQARLAELKALVEGGFVSALSGDQKGLLNARRALSLKREILLDNTLLDFDKLLVGRYRIAGKARSIGIPALGTQPNNWSNQTSSKQAGFNCEVVEMSNLRGNPTFRTIYRPEHSSSIADLRLHWNGDRFLFTMTEPNEHHWQVYEIGVDGNGFRQMTKGTPEHIDYMDATYLPNGKMIVTSTVGGQGVPCVNGGDQVGNLCQYDPVTHNMRRLTFDQDANWNPVLLKNGRVMYIRWEYTDLTHYFSRIVMHMNPDGTEQRSLYGSGSVFPTSILDVTPLPENPSRFVGIISGHHGTARSGRMIIFDPSKSRKEEKGMIQELPFRNRPIIPIVKDQMVDGVWPQLAKPQPINDNYYIVTARLNGQSLWGIYLIDVFDNLTLIAEFEGEGLIYGIPIRKTPMPPVIPEKVNLKEKEATVFIQDIYEGEGLPGVKRGDVKELRVFAYEYAYVKSPSNHGAQGIQSGWDIKRLIGTVPVEEDGSAMFKIPANTPISLQPLDKDGAAIQWMRSWLTGMPGETVSCVGCHEDQNQIPVPKRAIASTKQPQLVKTADGGIRSFTFDLEVQPILDRNCVVCHNEKIEKLNFVGKRKDHNGYGLSYLALHPFVHRQGPEAGMKVLYPYEYHASNSQLIRMLKNGHQGVMLTDKEWRSLYNWIDFNAPDKGIFEYKPLECGNQYDRRIALNKKYANGIYADWKREIQAYADYLETNKDVSPVKRAPSVAKRKEVKVSGFPFDPSKRKIVPERKVIEIAPGESLTFVKIPAGKFVMGRNVSYSDASPAFMAEVKHSFWMSEKEITNGQLRLFVSNHDSRYIDQQWKDHVTEGYEANRNEQVASRVSYHEAVAFCQKASQKTGLRIALPSEVEWEWACRAGSGDAFWYGGMQTDFSKFENLADKQTLKLAVTGVNPQPMKTTDPDYPYYIWLPKNDQVDDGNVLISAPGSYQANPFGLYDMHGNVAEWTDSDYLPYPLNSKTKGNDLRKVVRGGSWKEHPRYSTAFVRKAYLPEQKPYNVGFRVIIKE